MAQTETLAAQAAAMKAQVALVNAQTARIDAFENQAVELMLLKRQITELQATVSATQRLDAARPAAGI